MVCGCDEVAHMCFKVVMFYPSCANGDLWAVICDAHDTLVPCMHAAHPSLRRVAMSTMLMTGVTQLPW